MAKKVVLTFDFTKNFSRFPRTGDTAPKGVSRRTLITPFLNSVVYVLLSMKGERMTSGITAFPSGLRM